jgi:hypothetical protein
VLTNIIDSFSNNVELGEAGLYLTILLYDCGNLLLEEMKICVHVYDFLFQLRSHFLCTFFEMLEAGIYIYLSNIFFELSNICFFFLVLMAQSMNVVLIRIHECSSN